eukprot:GFUD01020577.1.p1 GENE.GFUD01020577.1~~GFUD01020577.1.p1  ORF type:complete len:565 (-),score=132.36 GFUD01020577.1:115-1809(-)
MESTQPSFLLPDYLVLAAVLLCSSLIGLYYRFSGGKQKTQREYLLADGGAAIIPVAFSLMASFMSAITLLGVSQENYTYGTQFVMINLSYVISTPIAAYVFLPVFYGLQSASVYRYLEKRFGYPTRLLASLAFTLQMVLYMGIVLYAPALALSAVTGLHFEGAVIAIGLVCTFYSTLGGMKAVLMTDLFQSLLMFAAVFSVIICCWVDAGSLWPVLENANLRGRIQFLEMSFDPTVRHTVWSQVFGGCFVYCSLYAVNQAQVQRLLTLPTLRSAQAALWIQVPILMVLSLSTSLAGLCIFYRYRDCDPIMSGQIRSGDQLLPLYIVDRMSEIPGLPGLAVAGIFSGSLSTVSSAINSLAAVTLEDYIRPFITLSDSSTPFILKILALVFGAICIALAFLADILGTGVLQASLTIFGVVGGPLLALFTLGILCRRVEQRGAIVGFLAGLAFISWIGFGGPKPPSSKLAVSVANCSVALATPTETFGSSTEYFYLYRISYAWTCCIGFFVTLLVGILVSELVRLVGATPGEVEPLLLAKVVRRVEERERQGEQFRQGEKYLENLTM